MHTYLGQESLIGLFYAQAEKYGSDIFLQSKMEKGRPVGQWVPMTWSETADKVRKFGAGLIELGLNPGDRVAIFAHNQPRWVIADLGIQGAKCVGVPIYPTSTDEQLSFILNDCGARAVVVGDQKLLEQAVRVKPQTETLEYIIATMPLDAAVPDTAVPDAAVMDFDKVMSRAAGSASALAGFDERRKKVGSDDDAAIIYTSGTTGEPKGAVLTHSNFISDIEMLLDTTITRKMIARGIRMTSLCHLPLCHIYGRTSDYHVLMAMGGVIYFAESFQKVPENLMEVRPQMLITIPRLYEKVYEQVKYQSGKMKGIQKKIFNWAFSTGEKVVDHLSKGERLPTATALSFALAGNLVFNRIKRMAGLDRVVFAGSGGGALSGEINRFFRAMNVQVGEGYGLTETTSALTWNSVEFLEPPPDKWIYRKSLDWLIDTIVVMQSQGRNPFTNPVGMVKLTFASNYILPLLIQKPGTVGRPCKYTEIKIAQDGEILAKGPQVFERDKGYFNRPDLTAEVFTEDGYFMTGDIGRFDEQGFLIITDRKKELLVTAGGKNVAPHPIELLLILDHFIEQACVIGDARKYLAALLVPQFAILEKWARQNGICFNSRQELIEHPEVVKLYDEKVQKANGSLARYEQIKKFRILPREFSEETGELTPSLKMKRRVIREKFKEEIESCYRDIGEPQSGG